MTRIMERVSFLYLHIELIDSLKQCTPVIYFKTP